MQTEPLTDPKISHWTPELRDWLSTISLEAGFSAAGVAPVRDPADPAQQAEAARFSAWIASGQAGEMDYLKRADDAGNLLRAHPRIAIPWARSVIVCAFNYNADAPRSIDPAPANAGWIGRYAWSGRATEDGSIAPTDYHDELLARLRRIEASLQARTPCTTRCYVDTGPFLERSLAAEAGVGWIGRNTCVINQQLGSWLLLGVIVTSLPIPAEPTRLSLNANDRCGSCTRCIDACPTDALAGSGLNGMAREMDASRCIAYLTIEKKGAIPEELREPIGRQVFGCDICQDVCPWNRKAPIQITDGMTPRPALVNPGLDWLASLDTKSFKQSFKGSPLERTGRKRLQRNVAIAMGNSGESTFLPQLSAWANEPPTPADTPNDAALRESAAWARTRILADARP
jgi:epoxyqueuosine reductase